MNASYGLYQRLQEAGHEEMASQALSVAKDIHEIKKEYLLIMRGLSEAMEDERSQEGMELSELLNILRRSLQIRHRCPDRLHSRSTVRISSLHMRYIPCYPCFTISSAMPWKQGEAAV